MKLLIGIPCMDQAPYLFSQSMDYLQKPEGTSIYYNPNSLIYDSRNIISLYAIENKFDYVMWIDSDMVLPRDTIIKLLHDADKLDADMVTGLYVKRKIPTSPVIYKELTEPVRQPDGTLKKNIQPYFDFPRNVDAFPVAGCGLGCCLTSVSLLKDVWDHFGPAFNPYPWAGEDISFCYRVNKLPSQIYCDRTIECGHVGTFVYTPDLLKRGDDT